MSTSTEAAREDARQGDGKFGEQHKATADPGAFPVENPNIRKGFLALDEGDRAFQRRMLETAIPHLERDLELLEDSGDGFDSNEEWEAAIHDATVDLADARATLDALKTAPQMSPWDQEKALEKKRCDKALADIRDAVREKFPEAKYVSFDTTEYVGVYQVFAPTGLEIEGSAEFVDDMQDEFWDMASALGDKEDWIWEAEWWYGGYGGQKGTWDQPNPSWPEPRSGILRVDLDKIAG